jgi:iron-sulfur cluster assembly protein
MSETDREEGRVMNETARPGASAAPSAAPSAGQVAEGPGVSLTEAAAAYARTYLARQGQGAALRVRVTRAGCSGYGYAVEPAQERDLAPTDRAFESHGVRVVVDAESLPLLAGTEIDYVREGLNGSFRYLNPKATATCGCGTSFSA